MSLREQRSCQDAEDFCFSEVQRFSSSVPRANEIVNGDRRVRVLFFLSRLDLAGTECQAVEIATRLDPAKFRVYFASLFKTGPLVEQIRKIADVHAYFPLTSFKSPSFPLSVFWLARFLRRNRIQILQCFDFYSNVLGALAGRLARVSMVITSRRHIGNFMSRQKIWLEGVAFRLSDHVLTNCRAASDVLVNSGLVKPGKIRVIYNGIDLARYDRLPDLRHTGQPVVGMVANFRPAKDHACFLRAAALVAREHPTVRFVLIGARTQNPEVQETCSELRISHRTNLMGEQPPSRIPEMLSSFSVSVLTSHGEGLPNAVLESMAAGIPVVATAVGGCRELIVDGVTGFLIPPGDSQALAEKILFLLRNPDVAQQMGRAGKARAEVNDYAGVMEQWTNFYLQELKKCGVQRP